MKVNSGNLSTEESKIISKVLKLIRILCSYDRTICLRFVQEGIINIVRNKFILSFPQLNIEHFLFIESMKLWRICLAFFLEHSGNFFYF